MVETTIEGGTIRSEQVDEAINSHTHKVLGTVVGAWVGYTIVATFAVATMGVAGGILSALGAFIVGYVVLQKVVRESVMASLTAQGIEVK